VSRWSRSAGLRSDPIDGGPHLSLRGFAGHRGHLVLEKRALIRQLADDDFSRDVQAEILLTHFLVLGKPQTSESGAGAGQAEPVCPIDSEERHVHARADQRGGSRRRHLDVADDHELVNMDHGDIPKVVTVLGDYNSLASLADDSALFADVDCWH
jgi:hypothetical protein